MNFISESAVNPFISPDGMLNVSAVTSLAKRVATAAKKLEAPKVLGVYYTGKDLQGFVESKSKKGDHKYLVLRAQQIRVRKRVPAGVKPEQVLKKGSVLLVDYDGLTADLEKQLTQFHRAANSHNGKADKTAGKVKVEKGKIRDAANAEFDAAATEMTDLLTGAGVKETNVVTATSMFGRVVIVKLPSGRYVTLGKSDATKFNAAKKALRDAAKSGE